MLHKQLHHSEPQNVSLGDLPLSAIALAGVDYGIQVKVSAWGRAGLFAGHGLGQLQAKPALRKEQDLGHATSLGFPPPGSVCVCTCECAQVPTRLSTPHAPRWAGKMGLLS